MNEEMKRSTEDTENTRKTRKKSKKVMNLKDQENLKTNEELKNL